MQKHLSKIIYLLLIMLFCGGAQARQIVDMSGRTVDIPVKAGRAYTPSPPGSIMLYTLNPDGMCGLLSDTSGMGYSGGADERIRQIPKIGSLTGEGRTANLEVLMSMNPDLIVLFVKSPREAENSANENRAVVAVERLHVPYVFSFAKDLRDYPAAYEFLGEAMGVPECGKVLADYIRETLAEAERVVAQVSADQRPVVYYAGGVDNLNTVSEEASHGILLKLAGTVGTHKHLSSMDISADGQSSFEKISFEQVMAYNPDVIVAMDPAFYQTVYTSPQWRQIKAVQNKRVLLPPRGPFNWFDRPPSFMGALGLKWLLAELYPAQYPLTLWMKPCGFTICSCGRTSLMTKCASKYIPTWLLLTNDKNTIDFIDNPVHTHRPS